MSAPEPEQIVAAAVVEIDGREVDVDQISAWCVEHSDTDGSLAVLTNTDEVVEERGDPTVLEERLRAAITPPDPTTGDPA